MKALVKLSFIVVSVVLMACLWTPEALAVPDLILPNPVYMRTSWNGVDSLLNVTLSGFPAGVYDISEGTYLGWCADKDADIDFYGTTNYYPVMLYSSYDPDIPIVPNPEKGGNWNIINYIINQHGEYSTAAVQFASWYFMNGLAWEDIAVAEGAQELVTEALENGSAFEPAHGDVIAVLCDGGESVQPTFIEVSVTPEASTLILFGSGLSGLLLLARKKRLLKF